MHNRSSKEDSNQAAARIVAAATSEDTGEPAGSAGKKNPHAVALGRLGGKKGGPARARALSAKRRKEIAKKAAKARWKDHRAS